MLGKSMLLFSNIHIVIFHYYHVLILLMLYLITSIYATYLIFTSRLLKNEIERLLWTLVVLFIPFVFSLLFIVREHRWRNQKHL